MAPSATETTTIPSRTVDVPTVKLTTNTGPYKELAPIGYEKKAEEEGIDGHDAAKVGTPGNVSFISLIMRSTKITSQPGAKNHTHHLRSSNIEIMV